jgi:hypothetical protein
MACCRPSRTQIARDGVKGIIISTIEDNGAPETALIDKNTSYVVAKYNTLRGRYMDIPIFAMRSPNHT